MLERGQALLTVEIRRLEISDYKEAHRAVLRRTVSSAPLYVTMLFLFFFFLYWAYNRDRTAAGILLLIACGWIGYFKWLAHREWKEACRRVNEQLPARFTLTENGVIGETPRAEGFRAWTGYVGYAETPRTVVLGPPSASYTVIPKSALNAEGLTALRGLLQSKLKKL